MFRMLPVYIDFTVTIVLTELISILYCILDLSFRYYNLVKILLGSSAQRIPTSLTDSIIAIRFSSIALST